MLAHDLRIEAAGAITGHLDFDFTHGIGEHGFRAGAVAGVAAIAARRVVLRIAEMLIHLDLQPRLQDLLGEIAGRSGTKSLEEVLLVVVHGQQHDLGIRRGGQELLAQLQPARRAHPDIDQGHVGAVVHGQASCLGW